MTARDAVLFNTLDTRLRKKVSAKNMAFDAMIKLGLAYEHRNAKSNQMEGSKAEDISVRMVQEEVN